MNAVTLAGPVAASLVFLPAYYGNQPLAGVVLIVAGAFDVLDGAVARLSSGVTRFGGYLDSVVDRYSDFAVFFGILVYIDRHWEGRLRLLYLILWGLSSWGRRTTAYVRARAETIIPLCKVGFMERPERMVTIILGLLWGNVHISLVDPRPHDQPDRHPEDPLRPAPDGRSRAPWPVLAVDVSARDRLPLRLVRGLHPPSGLRPSPHSTAMISR